MAKHKKSAKKRKATKAKARKVCMLVPADKKVKLIYKKGARRRKKSGTKSKSKKIKK